LRTSGINRHLRNEARWLHTDTAVGLKRGLSQAGANGARFFST
jgi:hypothetical protein